MFSLLFQLLTQHLHQLILFLIGFSPVKCLHLFRVMSSQDIHDPVLLHTFPSALIELPESKRCLLILGKLLDQILCHRRFHSFQSGNCPGQIFPASRRYNTITSTVVFLTDMYIYRVQSQKFQNCRMESLLFTIGQKFSGGKSQLHKTYSVHDRHIKAAHRMIVFSRVGAQDQHPALWKRMLSDILRLQKSKHGRYQGFCHAGEFINEEDPLLPALLHLFFHRSQDLRRGILRIFLSAVFKALYGRQSQHGGAGMVCDGQADEAYAQLFRDLSCRFRLADTGRSHPVERQPVNLPHKVISRLVFLQIDPDAVRCHLLCFFNGICLHMFLSFYLSIMICCTHFGASAHGFSSMKITGYSGCFSGYSPSPSVK